MLNHEKITKPMVLFLGFFMLGVMGAPLLLLAEKSSRAGIIPNNIWYSEDVFFAGGNIRIYSVLFNNSDLEVSGQAEFNDSSKIICTKSFIIMPNDIVKVWCDWTANYGNEKIGLKIINARAVDSLGKEQKINLVNAESRSSEIFIDMDTDGDKIGNREDRDDDNDGLSDDEEAKLGTNPLVADTDGDGLKDGEEIRRGTNPLNKDSDKDGLVDGEELRLGKDPTIFDNRLWQNNINKKDDDVALSNSKADKIAEKIDEVFSKVSETFSSKIFQDKKINLQAKTSPEISKVGKKENSTSQIFYGELPNDIKSQNKWRIFLDKIIATSSNAVKYLLAKADIYRLYIKEAIDLKEAKLASVYFGISSKEKGQTNGTSAGRNPILYAYSFFLSVISFVVSSRILFFVALLLVFYYGLRFLYKKFFSNNKYYY